MLRLTLFDPKTKVEYSIPEEKYFSIKDIYAFVEELLNLNQKKNDDEFDLLYKGNYFPNDETASIMKLGITDSQKIHISYTKKLKIQYKINSTYTKRICCHKFTTALDIKKKFGKIFHISSNNLKLYAMSSNGNKTDLNDDCNIYDYCNEYDADTDEFTYEILPADDYVFFVYQNEKRKSFYKCMKKTETLKDFTQFLYYQFYDPKIAQIKLSKNEDTKINDIDHFIKFTLKYSNETPPTKTLKISGIDKEENIHHNLNDSQIAEFVKIHDNLYDYDHDIKFENPQSMDETQDVQVIDKFQIHYDYNFNEQPNNELENALNENDSLYAFILNHTYIYNKSSIKQMKDPKVSTVHIQVIRGNFVIMRINHQKIVVSKNATVLSILSSQFYNESISHEIVLHKKSKYAKIDKQNTIKIISQSKSPKYDIDLIEKCQNKPEELEKLVLIGKDNPKTKTKTKTKAKTKTKTKTSEYKNQVDGNIKIEELYQSNIKNISSYLKKNKKSSEHNKNKKHVDDFPIKLSTNEIKPKCGVKKYLKNHKELQSFSDFILIESYDHLIDYLPKKTSYFLVAKIQEQAEITLQNQDGTVKIKLTLSQHNIEQLITGLFRVPFHKLHLTIANIKLPHNFSPFAITAAFEEPIINFNYEENSQQQIFSYSNTKKWIAIPNPNETMKELKKTVMNYFATNLRSNYEYYSFNCFRFVSIYQSPIDDNSKFSELHLPSVMPIILSVVDHDYYFPINILISNEQKTFHFHTNDTIRDMKKFLSTKYRSEISKISIFSGNNELTDNLNISHDATNLNSSQVFTAVFPKIKIKSFINLETKKTDDNYYIKIEKSYTISQAEDYIKNNYKGLNWTNIKIYFTHSQKTLKSFLEIENNQTVELYLYKTVKVKCEEIVDWEVNEKLLLHKKFSVLLDKVSRKLKKPKENIRLVSFSNNEDVTNKYVIDFPNNSPLICAISTNYVLGTQSETSTQFVPHIPLEPPKKLDKKKFTPKIIKIDHNNQQNNQLSNEQPQQQTSNTDKTTNNRISEEYSGSIVHSNITIGDNKIETTKSNSDRDNSIDISVDSETEDSDMSYGSFSDKRENSPTKQMSGKSHLNVETEEEEACLLPYSVQIDDEPPFQIYLPDESIIHNVKEKIAELKDIDDPSIISILYAGKTLSGDLPLKVLNLDEDDILQVYISNIEDLLLMTGKALKCWNLDEYYSDYESYSE